MRETAEGLRVPLVEELMPCQGRSMAKGYRIAPTPTNALTRLFEEQAELRVCGLEWAETSREHLWCALCYHHKRRIFVVELAHLLLCGFQGPRDRCVARSTTEEEYIAMACGVKGGIFLRGVLRFILPSLGYYANIQV